MVLFPVASPDLDWYDAVDDGWPVGDDGAAVLFEGEANDLRASLTWALRVIGMVAAAVDYDLAACQNPDWLRAVSLAGVDVRT